MGRTRLTRISVEEKTYEKAEKPSSKIKAKPKDKRFACELCSKYFGGLSDLRKHLLIHTDERPFQCSQCDMKFRQSISMKNHLAAIHHISEKWYVCDICDKSFPIKERLRLHKRIHTGERPYACTECPKRFARSGQLNQHKASHLNNIAYECELCNKSFARSSNLKTHMLNHTENKKNKSCPLCKAVFIRPHRLEEHLLRAHSEAQDVICTICEKSFKGSLGEHIQKHHARKDFKCEQCPAKFTQQSQLKVHQRIHSGERPHECQICWNRFGYSTVLKLHYRKHTGEKPFKCLLCKENEVSFSQLPHLKTHMRTIHKKDQPYMCEGCEEFFKTKIELEAHVTKCDLMKDVKRRDVCEKDDQSEELSRLRILIATVIKRMSNEERLTTLGFGKRLIDNVLISALQLAKRKHFVNETMSELERLKRNITELFDWLIPEATMRSFKQNNKTMEAILEDFAKISQKPTNPN